MDTLEFQESTSIHQTKDENQSLLSRILKYKVFIICLSLILAGILFLVIASFVSNELGKHLLRDVGIVLFTTGLVVFAADYMTRKDFIALLATELEPMQEEVRTSRESMLSEMTTCKESMLSEMSPLKTNMSSLILSLQHITQLRQDIPTLSAALDEIRTCISLGATMATLGIKQIYKDRWQSNLLSKLEEAAEQTEIKILGIVASEVNEPGMEGIIRQKLEEGCKFKILCLDPASRFVDPRAAEENREPEEMRDEIVARIIGWKNFVRRVPENMRSKVQLKCYDSTPCYFLLITGTLVVVGFYLGTTRGATGPHLELEVKEGGIATAFIEHFDSLWEAAKDPPVISRAADAR